MGIKKRSLKLGMQNERLNSRVTSAVIVTLVQFYLIKRKRATQGRSLNNNC